MCQIVNTPTREKNILDLILTTDNDMIHNCEVGEKLGTSDHHIIRFSINTTYETQENFIEVPDYRKANFDNFRKEMKRVNWYKLMDEPSAENALANFKDIFQKLEKENIPRKKKRQDFIQKPLWMEKKLEIAITKKRKAYKRLKSSKDEESKIIYERLQTECRKKNKEK